MTIFKIIGRAAVAYYDEMFPMLLMGAVTLVAMLLIIPAPFAFAGLYAAAQRAVRGEGAKWHHFWTGVKEYGPRLWLLMFVFLLGYALIWVNIWFYNTPEISPFPASLAVWVTPVWIIIALLWTGTAFYAPAFLVELQEPKAVIIFRSSLFLTILRPFGTLLWIVLSILLLALSIGIPILLFVSPALIITLQVMAVRTLVHKMTEQLQEEAAEEEDEA